MIKNLLPIGWFEEWKESIAVDEMTPEMDNIPKLTLGHRFSQNSCKKEFICPRPGGYPQQKDLCCTCTNYCNHWILEFIYNKNKTCCGQPKMFN